jgi:hypothetical protein
VTDGYTATFYADLTADAPSKTTIKPPADLHRLTYDATTKRITDTTYATTWDKTTTPWTALAPATGTTRVIANDVVDNGGPIFKYYSYDTAAIPSPSVPLGAGGGALSLAELKQVARVDISFKVLPTRGATGARTAVTLQDEVYVRAADPNDDAPTPTCA